MWIQSTLSLKYPPSIKKHALREPSMEINDFYNPINYPTLPYDKHTCEHMCVSLHYAESCGCFMYSESKRYSGTAEGWPLCEIYNDQQSECTVSYAEYNTPADVVDACECYDKCNDSVEIRNSDFHKKIPYFKDPLKHYGGNREK